MLAGSAAALAVPLLAVGVPELRRLAGGVGTREATRLSGASQTAGTMPFSIQHNTGSDTVYAFVTGLSVTDGNALVLLESDGRSLYRPSSPSAPSTPRRPTAP
jgi:hypothetical protein